MQGSSTEALRLHYASIRRQADEKADGWPHAQRVAALCVRDAAGKLAPPSFAPNEGPIGVYSTPVDMRGKTVVITGSNTGIGYETALRIAESGATVSCCPVLYPKGRASRGAGDGYPACVIAHDARSLHPGQVVMAGRSTQRLSDAAERIRSRVPSAMLECMQLDLASLESVRDFAKAFEARHSRLD